MISIRTDPLVTIACLKYVVAPGLQVSKTSRVCIGCEHFHSQLKNPENKVPYMYISWQTVDTRNPCIVTKLLARVDGIDDAMQS